MKLEGAELAEQFRAIADEQERIARVVSNIGKPLEDNNYGREAVRLRVAATEIDRLLGKLGEVTRLHDEMLVRLGRVETERDALSSRLDACETKWNDALNAYAAEHKIVARIWDLYGRPSYDDLKGRSIYDLVSESISRAQTAESRLDACRALRDQLMAHDKERHSRVVALDVVKRLTEICDGGVARREPDPPGVPAMQKMLGSE